MNLLIRISARCIGVITAYLTSELHSQNQDGYVDILHLQTEVHLHKKCGMSLQQLPFVYLSGSSFGGA